MKKKTLVMVDIQKEFKGQKEERLFGNLYIQAVMKYIKEAHIDKLVWVVDANKETISLPTELYRLKQYILTEVYWKNYSVMKVLPPQVLEMFIDKFMVEHSDGRAFIGKGTETLFIKTGNHHLFQEMTSQLLTFIDSIKEDEVYLIGGAVGECIQDIEKVMSYYNIGFQMIPELIYPVPYSDESIYEWEVKKSPNPKGDFFLF